ncbi:unnamed protein product [Notodromas monacha]|uniref:B30.2/SPRY domain-containing protein n=1 Tax=Notodromas monacha TaxID=399045 RepID=A0A7R9GCK6_9CRUS|nr:unnamed protein product [Notodromas monacha]CAG0917751.1 unnamed protein product [Notodromas monacha]
MTASDMEESPRTETRVASKPDAQCYCAKGRNLNLIELQCMGCSRWFHESCISYQMGKLVPFMLNYTFMCKNCSATGIETFRKTQAQFLHICVTALANLQHNSQREGRSRTMFSKARELIPFIESHWESLTTMSRRNSNAWHQSIQRALVKEIGAVFVCQDRAKDPENDVDPVGDLAHLGALYPLFGLFESDLTKIRPLYDSHTGSAKGRGTKRKLIVSDGGSASQAIAKKLKGGDGAFARLAPHGYPIDHPFNKDVYRYTLAEPDPHAPFRQEFDECLESAGKQIPPWLYRVVTPPTVLLAMHDRAPQLKIGDHRMTVTGEKGYCMVRATHGVSHGTWYFECTIVEMPDNSATRIGWAQAYANLQAPLGYDKFGYSYRSRKGTKFHESNGYHYGEGYEKGDTIGMLIELPQNKPISSYLPNTCKGKALVRFKNHLYFEEKDDLKAITNNLTPLKGSKISFFKNGVSQRVAFDNIFEGLYIPAISLYKSASVTVNFGPNFKHPPEADFKPLSARAEEAVTEHTMADLLFLTENHGKLSLDMV